MKDRIIHVIKNKPSLSETEIKELMDFDDVLFRANKSRKRNLVKNAMALILIFGTISTLVFIIYPKETPIMKNHESAKRLETIPLVKPENKSEKVKVVEKVIKNQKSPTQKSEPDFVDAEPMGGYSVLYKYFEDNLMYPIVSKSNKEEGTVLVEFYINEFGQAQNVKILEGVSPELDTEADRLISKMPLWRPASFGDKKMNVRKVIPIQFTLKKSN